ncbi:D-2-hydroxyacid dehydrogenase [Peptostreptococcus equinus]|uniref:D-2-hydroxyacid dehydrogenase n=1 Tax=Peptostreptococcus equinus TaxID=3003601 RepID=A0ABY7JNV7_9FIRM|nr:D-2-hydroxyacid dehydrogenase [Peptostreptococcus sp. CBA3647]WAW14780.1 D-2-hydroxyacid dehydrogenase [Peptostreptococcus sp. CBA3647]
MIKILVTDGMEKNAVNKLKAQGFEVEEKFYEREELKEKIQEIDVIVVRSATKIDKDIINQALKTNKLKLIIRAGVGLDNIDVLYAEKNGINVRNTAGASTNAVAELVLGQMLVLARQIKIANMTLKDGIWNKKNLKGLEIQGKTLGIIGFGRIARNLANKAHLLGMNILYTDLIACIDENDAYTCTDLDTILREADYITIHTPLTEDTRNLIDAQCFEKMKDTAFLINCARGGIVVEEDLLEALNNNKIGGAALDCFVDEPNPIKDLLQHPLVSVTPHIGAATYEAQDRIGMEIVDIVNDRFAIIKDMVI